MLLSIPTLLALVPFFIEQANSQASGSGKTTRYWDCCKASCGWAGKAALASGPVTSCSINDSPIDAATKSGCNGGGAFMCSNQSPWAVSSTLAYGFAASSISGGSEASTCCACYQLTFTSGAVAGKTMIVQSTNTGGDLGVNQFDLAMPGGGFGIFNGCTTEWGTPSTGWGAQYGGVSSRSQCDAFPANLRAGCYWRFDWFMGADNPTMDFKQVACPAALTAKSGCVRSNDSINESPTGPAVVATWTSGASSPPTTSTTSTSTKPTTTSTTSTSTKPTTTSTSTSTTSVKTSTTAGGSGGAQAGHWAQCAGQYYTGPTVCAAPWTCTFSNPYFSQCL